MIVQDPPFPHTHTHTYYKYESEYFYIFYGNYNGKTLSWWLIRLTNSRVLEYLSLSSLMKLLQKEKFVTIGILYINIKQYPIY